MSSPAKHLIAFVLAALLLAPALAGAQTAGSFVANTPLSSSALNAAFAAKQDNLGTSGSGALARVISPALVTPALGVATGSSLALGGATLGSNVLAATGNVSATGTVTTTAAGSVTGHQFTEALAAPGSGQANDIGIGLRNDLTVTGNASNWTGATDFLSGNYTTTFSNTGTMPNAGGFQAGVYVQGAGTYTGLRGFVSHNEFNGAASVSLFKGLEFVLTNNAATLSNVRWIDCPDTSATPGGGSITNEWCIYSPGQAKIEAAGLGRFGKLDVTSTSNSGVVNGFYLSATNQLALRTATTDRWNVTASGHFLAATDNTYDIGASGASRPRNIYAGTNVISANVAVSGQLQAGTTGSVNWNTRAILTSPAVSTVQHGDVDAAAPVAQTITAQSVVAGTSNTAAPNFTFDMPKGTGTGTGGSFIVRVAPAGSTGTAQNAEVAALTIDSTKTATFGASISTPGNISLTAGGFGIFLPNLSKITDSANGNILITNSGASSFGLLQLGGTTSSFPAIKRNGTGLDIRLADDSGYTSLTVGTLFSASSVKTGVTTVASLTTCTGQSGTRWMVSDATVVASGNFGAAVTGGGANTVPVYCDGTSWKIGQNDLHPANDNADRLSAFG